jgi:hypothetical protein
MAGPRRGGVNQQRVGGKIEELLGLALEAEKPVDLFFRLDGVTSNQRK